MPKKVLWRKIMHLSLVTQIVHANRCPSYFYNNLGMLVSSGKYKSMFIKVGLKQQN
jgi:hypothetical protein